MALQSIDHLVDLEVNWEAFARPTLSCFSSAGFCRNSILGCSFYPNHHLVSAAFQVLHCYHHWVGHWVAQACHVFKAQVVACSVLAGIAFLSLFDFFGDFFCRNKLYFFLGVGDDIDTSDKEFVHKRKKVSEVTLVTQVRTEE